MVKVGVRQQNLAGKSAATVTAAGAPAEVWAVGSTRTSRPNSRVRPTPERQGRVVMQPTERDVATPEVKGPVRVFLADDRQIVADGLRAMLAPYGREVRLVGDGPPTEAIRAMARQLGADVVLLDVHSQSAERLELVSTLVSGEPPYSVVIFTNHESERHLFEALRRGVSGYLLQSCGAAELVWQLVRVCQNEVVIDPSMATKIAVRCCMDEGSRSWPGAELGLSQRQSEVVRLLTEGLSNRLIAERLGVGEETVKTHLRATYRALAVNDRAGAVAKVLRCGVFIESSGPADRSDP